MKIDRVDELVREIARELGVDPDQHVKGDPVEAAVYARFGCVLTLLLLRRVRDLEAGLRKLEDAITGLEWVNLDKPPQEDDQA